MDPTRFDALSRRLAARRTLLAGLGGLLGQVAAGGTGAADHRPSAARPATPRKKKKKCKPHCPACQTCKKGACALTADGVACKGGTCQQGTCVAGDCTPACTGGRVCQANGMCVCPPDKPYAAPHPFCDDTCRACCTSADCPDRNFMNCDHAHGSVCVCPDNTTRQCTPTGPCLTCCQDDDCIFVHRDPGDGFICSVQNACICAEGLSECLKADASGYYCADLLHDGANCGFCGRACTCSNGQCVV